MITNGDNIRNMSDEELAQLLITQTIIGALNANGVYDEQKIKSMATDVLNSACGKKDIYTALEWLKREIDNA